jgi:hypothetical protein
VFRDSDGRVGGLEKTGVGFSATADCCFSSLVSLMCSVILVEM